ncbi:TIGR02611 family protein [Microbacterium sp. C7(2022)]|uniref:TIGR02611 family protein n=1 Tax=Microbacterium sp. C7(2022) TaxID=2992759 RepID=UPI00237BAD31|nr:TIGR02611 family protein [Microbacterium sp. C7(2022)]MDE0545103.1 TIGR02611 family protein [Microbacterium sp. C7(2022)]
MSSDTAPLEREIRDDIVAAENPERPIRRTMRRIRAWLAEHPRVEIAYRVGVAIAGSILAIGGLILVPLPGPGWLIVFLGLAVLGTEFHWAHRISSWLKSMLDRFWTWWRQRRAEKTRKTSG